MQRPHPDCKAPHLTDHDYSGPSHACAGFYCAAPDCDRYKEAAAARDLNTVRIFEPDGGDLGITDLELWPQHG